MSQPSLVKTKGYSCHDMLFLCHDIIFLCHDRVLAKAIRFLVATVYF